MIRLVRSEWLKLRTTSVPWLLGGLACLFTGLGILLSFLSSGPSRREGPRRLRLVHTHTVDQLRNVVGAGLTFGDLFIMLLGVLCITTTEDSPAQDGDVRLLRHPRAGGGSWPPS